ncbi:MAG: prephenate dehydratase [Planctomycetota bacterium]
MKRPPSGSAVTKRIRDLRKKIDQIDEEIVQLLNRRADIVCQIGRVKRTENSQIYAPHREKEVYELVTKLNRGPLRPEGIRAIYREVMSASLALEKPLEIAYLGPPGTFTHQAVRAKFGHSVRCVPVRAIEDVFYEVAKGQVDYGVVPVENSAEGGVTDTLDMFMEYDIQICAEMLLAVHHNLMARCVLEKIRRIYSKPQVFGQCRMWLERNLPEVERVDAASTSHAAQLAAEEKFAGAIGSVEAGEIYDLKILARNIEDRHNNTTRFLVLGRENAKATGKDKTSILFTIKDEVGALFQMLRPFETNGINLTRIESRPSKRRAWDYCFFVDFLGHVDQANVRKALAGLEKRCRSLKVLGSFPAVTT